MSGRTGETGTGGAEERFQAGGLLPAIFDR